MIRRHLGLLALLVHAGCHDSREGAADAGTDASTEIPCPPEGTATRAIGLSADFDHTCVVMDTSEVRCWGVNFDGEVSINTEFFVQAPIRVVGLSCGVKEVSASAINSCALLRDSTVRCWESSTSV